MSELHVGDTNLGEGEYGKVFEGKIKNKTVAVKVVDLSSLSSKIAWSNEHQAVLRLSDNSSSYVCKFLEIGKTEDDKSAMIVMKKYDSDLYDYAFSNDKPVLSELEIKKIFYCVCKGVLSIHNKGIAHLDIRPENILFDGKTCKPYLCDFGSSWISPTVKQNKKIRRRTEMKVKSIGKRGTRKYSAPETNYSPDYDPFKADIYSLGVLLHVLFMGFYPPEVDKRDSISFDYLDEKMSKTCADLLKCLLVISPASRYSIDSVIKHPWFEDNTSPVSFILKNLIPLKRQKKK